MKNDDYSAAFCVAGGFCILVGTHSLWTALGGILLVASINCWTQIRTPRPAPPAKEEPKRLPYNGCFTGDCPHDNSNDCVSSLAQYVAELEGDDEKLRDENEQLRAEVATLRQRGDRAIDEVRALDADLLARQKKDQK